LILAAEDSGAQLHSGLDFTLLTLENLFTLLSPAGQLQSTSHGHIGSDVCIHFKTHYGEVI